MNEMTFEQLSGESSAGRILHRIYLRRLEKNPAYSIRAFANSLGVSQTLMSLIFAKKRRVSALQAVRFSSRLGMTAEEKRVWFETVLRALPEKAKGRRRLAALVRYDYAELGKLDSPSFRIERDALRSEFVARWYYVAILDFTEVRHFRNDPAWIAKKLGIHLEDARTAIEGLIRLGLLVEKNGRLRKTQPHLSVPTRQSSAAIREFHRQMSQKAIESLSRADDAAFARRKISGITLSVRSDRLTEAFRRIDRFRVEMADLLSEGPSDSLYHMNVQLFPLAHAEDLREEELSR